MILALALSVALHASQPAAAPAIASPLETARLPFPVSAGQKAYGLTVFENDRVERFELVLLGVLNNFLGPGQDLVIARLTDPKLVQAGVVAGMSGSPIYVDGKILGALGYSMGAFMKEGICGITPIGAMQKVRDLPRIDPFRIVSTATPSAEPYGDMIKPIAAPLGFSGVHPAVYAHFSPTFEKLGFVSAPGGAGVAAGGGAMGQGANAAKPGKLEAGGAIAATLVRGDLSIAATGTITSVDGNRLLAFGHPFLGLGAASIPMARSRIITIIPSMQRSFKVGEVLEEVGSFTQDRLTAIAGEVGLRADTVAVRVEVSTAPENVTHTYSYEVARDPRLTPELVQLVVANSLMRRTDAGLVGTVETSGTIVLEGGHQLRLDSTVAMERDPSLPIMAAMSISRPVEILWRNDFGPPLVKSIAVKAKLSRDVRNSRIEVLSLRQSPYAPGEVVHARVGLRPDGQPLRFVELDLALPHGLAPGDYELHVLGAGEANQLEGRIGGPLRPQSQAALIEALESLRQDGALYVMLVGKGASVRIGEALLAGLPLSYATQIAPQASDSRGTRGQQSSYLERAVPVGAFVSGASHSIVRVRLPN